MTEPLTHNLNQVAVGENDMTGMPTLRINVSEDALEHGDPWGLQDDPMGIAIHERLTNVDWVVASYRKPSLILGQVHLHRWRRTQVWGIDKKSMELLNQWCDWAIQQALGKPFIPCPVKPWTVTLTLLEEKQ